MARHQPEQHAQDYHDAVSAVREVAWALIDLATTEAIRATAVTALTRCLPDASHRTEELLRVLRELYTPPGSMTLLSMQ
jgi:hypothetical protein